MNASPIDRKNSHVRGHPHPITYKVWLCDWIGSHEAPRGLIHRVRWTVAGRRKARSFHTAALARDFHGRLKAAVAAGRPFDVTSGLPLVMAPQACDAPHGGRSRRRKSKGSHD